MSTPIYEHGVQELTNTAAQATQSERMAFIRRTYAHLAGAIFAFVALEYVFFSTSIAKSVSQTLLGSRYGWLLVLVAFIGVSYVADKWARSDTSQGMQYLGLTLYVAAEALIFVPLLYIAAHYSDPSVIPTAAVTTLILFGGLTGIVFLTKKDFSFLGGALGLLMFGAVGVIVASILFGFTLGLLFSSVMALLAAGYVLYYTSRVLHHYRTDQHVSAALTLFAAIALMFWYILRILMNRR